MISLKGKIEGILFASAQPVPVQNIAEVLDMEIEEVKNLLGELQEVYAEEDHGFSLKMVGGGYQLRTKPELKEIMAKFYEKKPPRLSQPMLEVLSMVAYKQPVTRPEIDRVRGVDSSGSLKSLLDRGLVEMKGRSDSVGNPVLYVTTPSFLEWFQIEKLADLPPLSEVEALNVVAEEGSEQLMGLLNKDEGLSPEDLHGVDEELKELTHEQQRLKNNLEEQENQVAEKPEGSESTKNSKETQSEAG